MSKSATLPNQNKQIKLKELPQENKFLRDIATRIISRPNVASKRWIKYQFERFAGGNNLSANLHSETPLIVFQGNSLVSLSHHANPQFFEEQFEFGFKRAFLTTLSKVVATGAIPTSCHICFMVPVSFNDFGYIKDWATAEVSMYNLPCHISFNILPGFKLSKIQCIPVISIMGQVNDKMKMQGYAFTHKGDMVFLLGETHKSLSEEYMQELYCQNEVISESINLSGESSILDHISMLIKNTLVNSVHAVSQNGLYAALVESCIPGRFGADITTDSELRNDLFLFGSVGVRFVVSVAPNKEDQFLTYLLENNILFTTLGHVTKEELRIDDISYGFISDIRKKYLKSLGDRFK